jgi:predicted nucleic acid-binding protein
MSFVLDSSVTLAWCFEDERTDATDALLRHMAVAGAVAPVLWPLEVLNGLAMAVRRQRIDAAQRQRLAESLHELPVTIDDETVPQAWGATDALAMRFGLTVHDAAYLELAQRLDLPLPTLDQPVRAAAGSLGVAVLGGEADAPLGEH